MLRFCFTQVDDLRSGDWVVVRSPLGDEPGCVLFGARDVDGPSRVELRYRVERRLDEQELAQAQEIVQIARSLIGKVADHLNTIDPSLEVTSLRVSLDGTTLLCACFGPSSEGVTNVQQALEERLGRPVLLETLDRSLVIYGSIGRTVGSASVDEGALLERVGFGRLSGNPRPNGWPRLGSRVSAGDISGILVGISVRHETATIRLDSGQEHEVPLGNVDVVERSYPRD